MFQPGIRVVRGPDWIWQNQGKCFVINNYVVEFKIFFLYKNVT